MQFISFSFKGLCLVSFAQGISVLGGKFPGGKCPGGICPRGYNYVLEGKCPGGKCPGGKCPGGICPWGKCPGGTCPGGYVLEPINISNNFNNSTTSSFTSKPQKGPLTTHIYCLISKKNV